jgi:predicted butyrate kinase (DUF1464 family)
MNIAQMRNKLIQEVRISKDELYRNGYVDGVLDFYNEMKKEGEWIPLVQAMAEGIVK